MPVGKSTYCSFTRALSLPCRLPKGEAKCTNYILVGRLLSQNSEDARTWLRSSVFDIVSYQHVGVGCSKQLFAAVPEHFKRSTMFAKCANEASAKIGAVLRTDRRKCAERFRSRSKSNVTLTRFHEALFSSPSPAAGNASVFARFFSSWFESRVSSASKHWETITIPFITSQCNIDQTRGGTSKRKKSSAAMDEDNEQREKDKGVVKWSTGTSSK